MFLVPLHILVTYLLDNVIAMGGETAFFFTPAMGRLMQLDSIWKATNSHASGQLIVKSWINSFI